MQFLNGAYRITPASPPSQKMNGPLSNETFSHLSALSCDVSDGWRLFNAACYKFFTEAKPWSEAEQYCDQQLNSTLVTINSQEENNFVKSLLLASIGDEKAWIGGNDMDTEGTWVWVDGSDWSEFDNWNTNEPNGGRNESCVEILPDREYKWNDIPCAESKAFICKTVSRY